MTEKKLEMKPIDTRIARTNYHVEFNFDENSRIDIRKRMMRVVKQIIEDELLNNDMLS